MWFVVLIYLFPLLCYRKRLFLVLWTATTLVWYFYSPLYTGPPLIIKSTYRSFQDGNVVRNWADTISCEPKIIRATKREEIPSERLRVVGSAHSWSGLICGDTVLSIDYCDISLNGEIATASAGCTVREVQGVLGPKGRMLHGFGSIMGQKIGGAIMTSLHGPQFNMFTDHIVGMSALLANGTEIRADPHFWSSSMGMLGIVLDVDFQTYPFSSVLKRTKLVSFEEAMTYLDQPLEGLFITGVGDTFAVETFSDPLPSNFTGFLEDSSWFAFGYDNLVQPLFILLGSALKLVNVITIMHSDSEERLDMVHAWSEFPGYTSYNSEYSVPLEECKDTIQQLLDLDVFMYLTIRKLHASPGLLALSPVDSCTIEPHLFHTHNYAHEYDKFMGKVERIMGGRPHWGKKFNTTIIPQSFKDYRAALDPDGFFMNDYTHHLLEGEPFHYKPFAYRDTLWVTLVVLTILSPCFRVEDWKVLLGGVCVLLSWIALLVHDNYMDGDHIHGKDHYDFKWASLYVGVTCYFLVCAHVEKRMYYLRCLFTIVIVGDGIIKWTMCDHCHGQVTIALGVLVGYSAYLERNKPEYTLL